LSGKEETFLICSFWQVSGLAIVGEMDRAVARLRHLLRVSSPLGLYAEEFEVERARNLGNSPQALSHLASRRADRTCCRFLPRASEGL
jgi:GH15 family glucan-1,4-alpha-glucosidase